MFATRAEPGRVCFRQLVEISSRVIVFVRAKSALAMPHVDSSHASSEQRSHFTHVQHATVAQPFVSAPEIVAFAQRCDDLASELHSSSRSDTAFVEDFCNAGIGMLVE